MTQKTCGWNKRSQCSCGGEPVQPERVRGNIKSIYIDGGTVRKQGAMTVVVTGGAGFIGSHVVDALVEQGEDVLVVDRTIKSRDYPLNCKARYCEMNICSPGLREVMVKEKPERVFHLAAQTSVGKSVNDPAHDGEVNILGSLNVIVSSTLSRVRKLVYASSSAAYGHPDYLPVDELHPLNPLAPYGVSKHTVEHYLKVYRNLAGLSFTALRFANVYGPRQNPAGEGGVVAIFTAQMLSGIHPVIYGDGTKSRDYIFVKDVVAACIAAGNCEASDIFNIGTGVGTCDHAIYDAVSHACRYAGIHSHAADRPGDIRHMVLDCTKSERLLNWKPQTPLELGIAETVAYYSQIAAKNEADY